MVDWISPDLDNDERAAALAGDALAVQHLKDDVRNGRNWYVAILEAIRMWKSPEECYNGEPYKYLIGGEAFDWLRLAGAQRFEGIYLMSYIFALVVVAMSVILVDRKSVV